MGSTARDLSALSSWQWESGNTPAWYSRRRIADYRFASFSLQNTPPSRSALSVMQFPVPKSVAEKQVGNPPASVVTFYSIPSLRKMSSSSAWLEFVVVPTLERSPADRDPAEPAVSANEDEAN